VAATPDVIVIGSGIVGCAVAYELGRRGAVVAVVDDRKPGAGATQASAGMLAPYLEAGEEGVHLEVTTRGLDVFDSFMAQVVADSGQRPKYRRTGSLTIAFDDSSMERLRHISAVAAKRGASSDVLDADGIRQEEPSASHAAIGGLLVRDHGYVAAGEFTVALVAAAQRHGVRFIDAPRAYHIRQQGDSVLLSGPTGTVTAGHVVIAAGSWAGQIVVDGAGAVAPVRPVRGQLLHLRATAENLRRVTWSDRCYLVPWDDGSMLVGATVEHVGFDERTTVEGMRDLFAGAAAALRSGWPAGVIDVRAGLRPATPDGLPIVGRSAAVPGLLYAIGHYRNGVLLSPLTAQLIADTILDNRLDPIMPVIAPERFGRL
jgi:glycine oxidase